MKIWIKYMEKISEDDFSKNFLNLDDVEGFSDYQESIAELLNIQCEAQKNILMMRLIQKSAKR